MPTQESRVAFETPNPGGTAVVQEATRFRLETPPVFAPQIRLAGARELTLRGPGRLRHRPRVGQ